MTEPALYDSLLWATFGFAVVTALALIFISAPYGRHLRGGWGPTIPSRIGWIVMELPAVVAFVGIFARGEHAGELAPLVLLGIWQIHYVHRTLIFPFRMRATGKRMPLLVACLAIVFNTLNAYLNARWISHFGSYATSWLADPRFIAGAAVFALGFVINFRADSTLFRLRKPGDTGYKIPRGGLYERVTCPNYLGELLEWTGWAIATWSLAGVAFVVYTAANLIPRAVTNHRWYRETFADYPEDRKILIPYLW
ncbi:DUF1295 domain-containing protein [Pseudenhygromyxa sp. WMMC2535]|uniref:DUF1295 domain-containing protein n=1 Tax=Pseudenhygromyxa sp. WMMC2535 TaxID=2712867 RepID=UPI001556DFC9|nr:DUF1295 domain-containing protein [Pseudenhygromyxa sp. WMMC2535]NVB37107.1 DUF1295 domain-containing protein [Pseudenhygromyxa sp. WMMC2535]